MGSLSSCAEVKPLVFLIPQIEIPAQVALPPVHFIREPSRICLDEENAQKLYQRERLLKEDGKELRALLGAINEEFGIDE